MEATLKTTAGAGEPFTCVSDHTSWLSGSEICGLIWRLQKPKETVGRQTASDDQSRFTAGQQAGWCGARGEKGGW